MCDQTQQQQQQQRNIEFSGTTEFASYARGQGRKINGVFHVAAPPAPEDSEQARRGTLDIVAVIDTSGSMSGSKLDLAKATLQFLVKNLTPTDSLSVVSYNSAVSVAVPLSKMDTAGKQAAEDAKYGKGCAAEVALHHAEP